MAIHYIEHYGFVDDGHSLAHYGVPGMRWRRHKYTGSSSRDYNYSRSSNDFTDTMRRNHDEAAARRDREIASRQRSMLRNAARRNRRNEHGNHDAAARQQFFDRVQDRNRAQLEIERERKARRRFSR